MLRTVFFNQELRLFWKTLASKNPKFISKSLTIFLIKPKQKKMKKFCNGVATILIMLMMVALFSCGETNNPTTSVSQETTSDPNTDVICPKIAPVLCGQHDTVGTISIWPAATGFIIQTDAQISQLKLYVGSEVTDLPLNHGGNPKLNKFISVQNGQLITWAQLRNAGMVIPADAETICHKLYVWIKSSGGCSETCWWGDYVVQPGGNRWWRYSTIKTKGNCCIL